VLESVDLTQSCRGLARIDPPDIDENLSTPVREFAVREFGFEPGEGESLNPGAE
jgi:hypothetical protein